MNTLKTPFIYFALLVAALVLPVSNDLILLLSIVILAVFCVLIEKEDNPKKKVIILYVLTFFALIGGFMLGNLVEQPARGVITILLCNVPILYVLSDIKMVKPTKIFA